jgi:hypothetical protein
MQGNFTLMLIDQGKIITSSLLAMTDQDTS